MFLGTPGPADGAVAATGEAARVASSYARRALGVDREISSSSSVMSAGISANSGVLRYRSPVSGSMQRTVAPLARVPADLERAGKGRARR